MAALLNRTYTRAHSLTRTGTHAPTNSRNYAVKTWSIDWFARDPIHKSIIPTYHFQKSLPKLPIPDLEHSCAKYLRSVTPLATEAELAVTQRAVDQFLHNEGPSLHKALQQRAEAFHNESFISEFWFDKYLEDRSPVVVRIILVVFTHPTLQINVNPFLMFKDSPDPKRQAQIYRAASLIVSALRFHKALRQFWLKPEV